MTDLKALPTVLPLLLAGTPLTIQALPTVLPLMLAAPIAYELEVATAATLPAPLNGEYSWIANGSMWTRGGTQTVVWVDDQLHGRMATRTLDSTNWVTVDLAAVTPTVFPEPFVEDSHNTIRVAVDSAGYTHVAGNMHATPLRYMRTAAPGQIDNWVTPGMIGGNESAASYPQFIEAADGDLYFMYRQGTAGTANWHLNRWDAATLTWTRTVSNLFAGAVDLTSAYPQDIAVDTRTGRWHMMWTIRERRQGAEGWAETNHDIYAAYSDNEGRTWRRYGSGTTLPTPITGSTDAVVVPLDGGAPQVVMNSHHGTIALDDFGRPHAAWLVADTDGVFRYRHVWFDGADWRYDPILPDVSAGTIDGTYPNQGAKRADMVTVAGAVLMIVQTGGLRAVDVATGTETVLADRDLLHHSPVFNEHNGTLYVLAPYERGAGPVDGDPADLAAQSTTIMAVNQLG